MHGARGLPLLPPASRYAIGGADPLHPADLGEWLDLNRHTDVLGASLPWVISTTSLTLTTGFEYGALTRVRTAGSCSKIKVHVATVGTLTDFKVGVYDPVAAALLALSSDQKALITSAVAVDVPLGSTLALAEGRLLVPFVATQSSVAVALRGINVSTSAQAGRTTAMGYRKSWVGSGYSGSFVALSSQAAAIPLLELFAD